MQRAPRRGPGSQCPPPAIPLLLLVVLLPASVVAQRSAETFVPGQLLLRFDPALSDAAQATLLAERGLPVRYHYRLMRAWWVSCPEGRELELAQELEQDARVEYAHPNYYGWRTVIPNDPSFGNSWGLHNTGQSIPGSGPGVNDADIDAPEAWDIRHDATPVLLAIVDSGCLIAHPDLNANIWVNPLEPLNGLDDDGNGLIDDIHGWDFLDNDNDPDDVDGHGTLVTGTACARGNNGTGSTGVAWEAQAIILKDGNTIPQVALSVACIEYAAAHGCAAANFSTGYGASAQGAMNNAVNTARNAGTIICVSAGNTGGSIEGGSLNVPAEFPQDNLFVIAASNNDDNRASFSSYGSVSVDIGAPGESIYTTTRTGGHSYVDGTSFSAPMATGAVALVRAQNPQLTHQTVISLFMTHGDPRPAWSGTTVSGKRLNLHKTLLNTPPPGPVFTLSITPVGTSGASLSVTNAPALAELYIPISLNPLAPSGTGPVFGLAADAFFTLLFPLGTHPFHVQADGSGSYSLTVPSGIPAGLSIQSRALVFSPAQGITDMSGIVTQGF